MLLKYHPHKKQIVIGLGIIVVIGIVFFRGFFKNDYSLSSSSYYSPSVSMEENASVGMAMGTNMKRVMPPVSQNGSVAVDVSQEERLIIKNGSLSIVVDNVEYAVEVVKNFALEKNGFVVTSNVEQNGLTPSGFVNIRIPSDVFDTGLDALRALGDVKSERVDGRDVTEEFVDLDAQVKNLKAAEKQFLTIMKRAIKIEDILAVQREITTVRGKIDVLEGRMKFLKESAAFSSLTVHLSSDPENLPVLDDNDSWKPLATAKNALRELLDFGEGVANIIIWIVVYIPVWIILWILFIFGKKIYQKTR
jgi:hypothetical protein